uniref:UPF0506 domain-containing protein n=1 Tax=Steinernema glaseri TaxID=37863 RepID=A0A1I8AF74_9BILA
MFPKHLLLILVFFALASSICQPSPVTLSIGSAQAENEPCDNPTACSHQCAALQCMLVECTGKDCTCDICF